MRLSECVVAVGVAVVVAAVICAASPVGKVRTDELE